jgi:uncharacterized metal-binding protein YceD (DUF177 family)
MGKMKELVIPFSGMKEGKYDFSYSLNDKFFEALEFSEIKKGNVKVDIVMERRATLLNLEIKLDGTVELECDRCGNTYDQPITDHRYIVVNLNADNFEDEDDLISLPSNYNELDLTQYIYEYIALAVPQKRVCPETTGCDPEVLKKLDQLFPGEQKNESTADDPRWDVLKKLKDNNK